MPRLLVHANEATAAQRRVFFHLVDSVDGITAETGEAAGQPQISSDGGAWTNTGIGTLTAIGNGRYYADLTQAAVLTAGTLIETRYKSANTAECPGDSVQVVAFDPNDTVRLGLTALPNAAAEAAGGLYTRGAGAGQINQPANGLVDVNVENWNTTAVPAEHTAGYPIVTIKDGTGTGEINTNAGAIALVDNLTTYTGNTPQTGDSYAIVNSGVHGNAAIKGFVDDIGVAGAGLTDIGGFSTTAKAQIQTEAEDAIVVHRLDELLNADSDIDGAAPPTVGSVFHELMSKTAGSFTFDQTTDSNEALRDRGDAAWITATGFSTHSAADVWSSVTRTLTAATNITSTGGTTVPQTGDSFARIGTAGAGLTDLGGMSTTMKAQVNAEALDVINVDTLIDGKTIVAALKIDSSILAGKISGAGTGTEIFVGLDGATTRVTVTVDASGNRTAVVYA